MANDGDTGSPAAVIQTGATYVMPLLLCFRFDIVVDEIDMLACYLMFCCMSSPLALVNIVHLRHVVYMD